MPDPPPAARPAEARLSTGNPGLDAMLEGGLLPHRPYLLIGPAGTGKTTLALQFLCDGIRHGERALLVTLEEPPNEARINHRALAPELEKVEVFDAIPDIMRYERAPFKDIAAVRSAVPFHDVPLAIRRTPELTSVEVTITALEQLLRSEVQRRGYTRVAIDSLTALQYFCMKGFDPVGGAQTFLRFLSDLRVTTFLTVESPLEDVETAERMLARGEIRLFRWERDGLTVRAVGVEKFRGSSHDVRLHPYRIGPRGVDIQLDVTISRDTRQIIEPVVPPIVVTVEPPPVSAASLVDPLSEEIDDLLAVGADVVPVRFEVEAARVAADSGDLELAGRHLARATALTVTVAQPFRDGKVRVPGKRPGARAALARIQSRAEMARPGVPPTTLPPAAELVAELATLLDRIPASAAVVPPPGGAVPEAPSPQPAAPRPTPRIAPPAPALAAEERPAPEAAPPPRPASPPPAAAPPAPEPPRDPPHVVESPLPPPPPTPTAPIPAPEVTVATPGATFEPPPLPVGVPALPEEGAAVAPVGEPPAPAERATAPAGSWTAPALAPAIAATAGSAPSSGAPPSAEAPPASVSKKRRRTSTPRKKAAAPPVAEPGMTPPVPPTPPAEPPTTPGPVVSDASAPLAPAPAAEPAPPKPKRRAPRKRKAPPVVAATAEAIPPGVFGAAGEPPPASDPPKSEGG